MFDNTLHIPLRFYNAVTKQDRYKSHSTTRKFFQYTDTTHLPEFQIKVAEGTATATFSLVSAATGAGVAITPTYYMQPFTGYTYLIYDRHDALSAMAVGEYYLDVTAGSDHFFSEVFAVGDIVGKTIIEYYNTNDLGGIDYTNGTEAQYKNTLIIDATLAKPEYTIDEEATEDGDGNVLITFQRRVKLFKMWFYAPEYIADAVSLIPLHDYVTLTTNYGESDQETGSVYDFAVTTEWMDNKGLAKITCEFRDSPIIKTHCANNLA
jgi:hypothetical protein